MKAMWVALLWVAQGFAASTAVAANAGWVYAQDKDKMTDVVTQYARLDSEEVSKLGIGPYAVLTIEHQANKPEDVYFVVYTGTDRFDCSGKCKLKVRFDDGPVEEGVFTYKGQTIGTKQVLSFANTASMIAKLKTAKRFAVEFKMLTRGGSYSTQIGFNVAGLKWP